MCEFGYHIITSMWTNLIRTFERHINHQLPFLDFSRDATKIETLEIFQRQKSFVVDYKHRSRIRKNKIIAKSLLLFNFVIRSVLPIVHRTYNKANIIERRKSYRLYVHIYNMLLRSKGITNCNYKCYHLLLTSIQLITGKSVDGNNELQSMITFTDECTFC